MSPIERSSGGGGGGGVGAVLFSSVLNADAASFDTGAGGFSTAFNILEVFLTARTSEAVVLSEVAFTLNGDSAAHYDFVWVGNSNVTVINGNNTARTSWNVQTLGASAGAGFAGVIAFAMPAYAGTTLFKPANWFTARPDGTAAANMSMLNFGGTYRSTAAVTRVQAAPLTGGVNFKAGSSFYVYGR